MATCTRSSSSMRTNPVSGNARIASAHRSSSCVCSSEGRSPVSTGLASRRSTPCAYNSPRASARHSSASSGHSIPAGCSIRARRFRHSPAVRSMERCTSMPAPSPTPTCRDSEPMEAELLRLREQVLIAPRDRTPLRLRGAGTKDFYSASNSQSTPCTTVDLRPFSGILDYEPSELVITARCGTPLSQIEAALAERGQFLGFEPPGFGADPTLGGIVAAGLSGPRRLSAGAVRDFVLGAALLAGDGELLQFGGRVMKNVAGFDVARLLCGSLGIFGIITQVCIKVLPRPRAEATVQLEMKAGEAIEAFNRW